MKAEKHLYTCLENFVSKLKDTPKNQEKYRDLLVFAKKNKLSKKTIVDKKPTIESFETNIIFKQFAMHKIQIICAVCSPKEILKLSEQEVIDWFFCYNVPLSEPFVSFP